ncbi:MAG: hypothetical protein ACK4ZJ_18595, partial [Allorhizobium sp.]
MAVINDVSRFAEFGLRSHVATAGIVNAVDALYAAGNFGADSVRVRLVAQRTFTVVDPYPVPLTPQGV